MAHRARRCSLPSPASCGCPPARTGQYGRARATRRGDRCGLGERELCRDWGVAPRVCAFAH
ncbi:hypothetical protein F750_1842 [Streptomyces sp. PAMC 26508]|nr:hypothetical protein F750_1842 [Streptomyces sp. PAMC 26508]